TIYPSSMYHRTSSHSSYDTFYVSTGTYKRLNCYAQHFSFYQDAVANAYIFGKVTPTENSKIKIGVHWYMWGYLYAYWAPFLPTMSVSVNYYWARTSGDTTPHQLLSEVYYCSLISNPFITVGALVNGYKHYSTFYTIADKVPVGEEIEIGVHFNFRIMSWGGEIFRDRTRYTDPLYANVYRIVWEYV
ncbi:MAG: hypothetical protein ACFFAX_16590, partial [Promethearchaeota archaeon]